MAQHLMSNGRGGVLDAAWVLVLVNLLPLAGVFAFGWDAFRLLSLFWLENIFIGLLGILRIIRAGPSSWFEPFFFTLHYGAFTVGHGILLSSLFGLDVGAANPFAALQPLWANLNQIDFIAVALAIAGSHLWSYVRNYEGLSEYERLASKDAMALPYRRVMITHIGLIVGAFLLQALGEPIMGLVALVAVKIFMDLQAHKREHRRLSRERLTN